MSNLLRYKANYSTFAAPLPFQSGKNWLMNRLVADTALGGTAAVQGIKGAVNAVKQGKVKQAVQSIPERLRDLKQIRSATLDDLDQIGANRGISKNVRAMRGNTNGLAQARKDVDYLPDMATDGRRRYNFPEPTNLDMRVAPKRG